MKQMAMAKRRTAKRTRRATSKKTNGSAKTMEPALDLESRIDRGEVRVTELETLRLQKLMHQANSASHQYVNLQNQANQAKQQAMKASAEFQTLVTDVKAAHGLKIWHDISLTDEQGGLVTRSPDTPPEVALKEVPPSEPSEEEQKD
jgi:hypothetical protein